MLSRDYINNKMRNTHINALTAAFVAKELNNFSEPIMEFDSVTSKNESKKIGFITRHLLTGEPTHSLILQGDHYDRV